MYRERDTTICIYIYTHIHIYIERWGARKAEVRAVGPRRGVRDASAVRRRLEARCVDSTIWVAKDGYRANTITCMCASVVA